MVAVVTVDVAVEPLPQQQEQPTRAAVVEVRRVVATGQQAAPVLSLFVILVCSTPP